MADWLTYQASDFLLFAPRTYYRLFVLYNEAIWPAQILALFVGAAAFALLWRGRRSDGTAVVAILAAADLWIAWAYFFERYQTINWAAKYFAIGFIVQAVLLSFVGPSKRKPFRRATGMRRRIGLALFVFALVLQPLIGPLLLHRPWQEIELLGLAPDPTAVATLGALLLLLRGRALTCAMLLPLAWCAISFLTLWTMGSPDAWVMPAVIGVAIAAAAIPSQESE